MFGTPTLLSDEALHVFRMSSSVRRISQTKMKFGRNPLPLPEDMQRKFDHCAAYWDIWLPKGSVHRGRGPSAKYPSSNSIE